jgi:hypothetical protein
MSSFDPMEFVLDSADGLSSAMGTETQELFSSGHSTPYPVQCCGMVLGQDMGLALSIAFSRLSTTQPFLLSPSLESSLE